MYKNGLKPRENLGLGLFLCGRLEYNHNNRDGIREREI